MLPARATAPANSSRNPERVTADDFGSAARGDARQLEGVVSRLERTGIQSDGYCFHVTLERRFQPAATPEDLIRRRILQRHFICREIICFELQTEREAVGSR